MGADGHRGSAQGAEPGLWVDAPVFPLDVEVESGRAVGRDYWRLFPESGAGRGRPRQRNGCALASAIPDSLFGGGGTDLDGRFAVQSLVAREPFWPPGSLSRADGGIDLVRRHGPAGAGLAGAVRAVRVEQPVSRQRPGLRAVNDSSGGDVQGEQRLAADAADELHGAVGPAGPGGIGPRVDGSAGCRRCRRVVARRLEGRARRLCDRLDYLYVGRECYSSNSSPEISPPTPTSVCNYPDRCRPREYGKFSGYCLSSIRRMAHRACSATRDSASFAARSRAGSAVALPTLPRATHTFRSKPRRLVRSIGVPANFFLNPASSSDSNSIKSGCSRSRRACCFINFPSAANLFQGQTARQSSQP